MSAKLKGVLTGARVLQPPLKMMQTPSHRCMEWVVESTPMPRNTEDMTISIVLPKSRPRKARIEPAGRQRTLSRLCLSTPDGGRAVERPLDTARHDS